MTQPNFTYRVVSWRVIDGDTIEATVDLGFHTRLTEQFRLARIDAPEMSTQEGRMAKLAVIKYLAEAGRLERTITVTSTKTEKWRRWLGEFWVDDVNLSDWLVTNGHAKVWGT